MKRASTLLLLLFVLFGASGCQRLGRKLFGTQERIIMPPPLGAQAEEFDINGDFFRVLLLNWMQGKTPKMLQVKACMTDEWEGKVSETCAPLPYYNASVGKTATFVQNNNGAFEFYNVASVFSNCNVVRIEYVQ